MRSVLLLLFFALSVGGCGETPTPDATILGRLEGRHYKNEHFGLDITIPDSWELVTEGVGKRMAKLAAKRDPQLEPERKKLRQNFSYVFKATRKSETKPNDPWLQLTILVHRGGASKNLKTSELYAKQYLHDISRGSGEVEVIDPITEVQLNGTSYTRVRYFSKDKDSSIFQGVYFRVAGDDVLLVVAYFGLPEHLPILKSVIRETLVNESK